MKQMEINQYISFIAEIQFNKLDSNVVKHSIREFICTENSTCVEINKILVDKEKILRYYVLHMEAMRKNIKLGILDEKYYVINVSIISGCDYLESHYE